ncbi:MAG: hypothetical protein IPG48_02605 [Saprospiraceae bacterium]|nr:hypothetical protein [Saprospiraceae bacterium]
MRFRLVPDGPVNDMVLHVKNAGYQQSTSTRSYRYFGVNMIYASFYYNDNPEKWSCPWWIISEIVYP